MLFQTLWLATHIFALGFQAINLKSSLRIHKRKINICKDQSDIEKSRIYIKKQYNRFLLLLAMELIDFIIVYFGGFFEIN